MIGDGGKIGIRVENWGGAVVIVERMRKNERLILSVFESMTQYIHIFFKMLIKLRSCSGFGT